jgi:hypothetical protein
VYNVAVKTSLPAGWKMRLVEETSSSSGSSNSQQRVRQIQFLSPDGVILHSRREAFDYMVKTGSPQVGISKIKQFWQKVVGGKCIFVTG